MKLIPYPPRKRVPSVSFDEPVQFRDSDDEDAREQCEGPVIAVPFFHCQPDTPMTAGEVRELLSVPTS